MPIHLIKGVNLALALLGPVALTLFFHWRALVTARRQLQSRP
ncbi:MAG TPA: hypothetical protein VGT98_10805 [Candidatus Elarobacter sp.]|nr:hypothetical protein [Candidatus Elarobacter sp.]